MDIEAKIKELEERIRQLESRPQYVPVYQPLPYVTDAGNWRPCVCGKSYPHTCTWY